MLLGSDMIFLQWQQDIPLRLSIFGSHGGSFLKLGVPFGGPHNQDYSKLGSRWGSPFFGKVPVFSMLRSFSVKSNGKEHVVCFRGLGSIVSKSQVIFCDLGFPGSRRFGVYGA